MTHLVDYLIEQNGIDSKFVDAWGKPATIARENQKKLLGSMGYAVDDELALTAQLEAEASQIWLSGLDPVIVQRVDNEFVIHVRVSIDNANTKHTLKIKLENNESASVKFIPVEHHLSDSQEIDSLEFHQYSIKVNLSDVFDNGMSSEDLLGYHELSLIQSRKVVARSRLIIAPERCYIPKVIQEGKKIWGLSVQLYCLKSTRNWGIGDFTDLGNLVLKAAEKGADFIGLNPIHALYPASPDTCSPYGPSSRRWLNYLYIDVTAISTFDSKSVQNWYAENNIDAELDELRALDFIDYQRVANVKHKALELVFSEYKKQFLTGAKAENKAFKAFVKEGSDSLKNLAIFEAIQYDLKQSDKDFWGWPVFPDELKDPTSPAVKEFAKQNKSQIEFYMFLQWQASIQFEQASKLAIDAKMDIGLYRDLAVGVSEGSAEIWGNQDLYCTDVSIGAPPDILGPLGQKWGLPPMKVDALIEQAYQPIIDLFSSNMHASGALRIDHVMALLRLWWVHKDDDAGKGAYVNYPVDDLLAILALESVRNQSLVIGEDLGTVPDSIRAKLQANGMYSYRVFFFEQAEDGGFYSPAHYPEQSMATLTTHDLPTLIGFWHCDDLALGKEVGLYPDPEVLSSLYDIRHENKQHILNTLHGHHAISDAISRDVNYVGMSTELNFGMQTHMASGSSALLSLQLEDWLQMEKPVNIPGTFNEYPNWRRKLSHNLEDIFDNPDINALVQDLNQRRKQASRE